MRLTNGWTERLSGSNKIKYLFILLDGSPYLTLGSQSILAKSSNNVSQLSSPSLGNGNSFNVEINNRLDVYDGREWLEACVKKVEGEKV